MERTIEVSREFHSQDFLSFIQVKQEIDEGSQIQYDRDPWAFLLNDEHIEEHVLRILLLDFKNVVPQENLETCLSEEEIPKCHWCSYIATGALDLIEHDFENHSKYYQGKRIHKSYKCPSCDFTSVEPKNIRNHFEEIHRNSDESYSNNANDYCTTNLEKNKKKKKKKPTWQTKTNLKKNLSVKLEQADFSLQVSNNIKLEEQRPKKMQKSKKCPTLNNEELAKKRCKLAARMRLRRAMESEEVKAERRRKQALHARRKRAKETPEQLELRRTKDRLRAKLRRSLETEEQRELRKERERLRAREKRAGMTVEEKSRLKEVQRVRQRFYRQKSKSVNGNSEFVHATELLSTPVAQYENFYQPKWNAHAYPKEESNDFMKLWTAPMLTEPILMTTAIPNSTGMKTNKEQISPTNNKTDGERRCKNRKSRSPRNKKNEGDPYPEAPSYEKLTNATHIPNLNNDVLTNVDIKFRDMNLPERFNYGINTSKEIMN